MQSKKISFNKISKVILIIFILCTLAFIWGNSLQDASSSLAASERVLEFLKPMLELFLGVGNVTIGFVRKLAHFVEFGLLGCELAMLSLLYKRHGRKDFSICLACGLAVGAVDEIIQIFTGRGAQVKDVLLDFFGAFCGTAIVFAIWHISCKIKKDRKEKDNSKQCT